MTSEKWHEAIHKARVEGMKAAAQFYRLNGWLPHEQNIQSEIWDDGDFEGSELNVTPDNTETKTGCVQKLPE